MNRLIILRHTAGYSWDVPLAGTEFPNQVPFCCLTVSTEVILCDAPCRGIFHRAVSLIPLAYTSIRWSTLSPRRHCVFALTIYGSFLVALQPYDWLQTL